MKGKRLFVSPTNTIHMNERLNAQQGVFLAPGDISRSFSCNLEAMPGHESNIETITVEQRFKLDALKRLLRIGIDRSVLFPDLDGFACSLREKMIVHSMLSQRDKTNMDLRSL